MEVLNLPLRNKDNLAKIRYHLNLWEKLNGVILLPLPHKTLIELGKECPINDSYPNPNITAEKCELLKDIPQMFSQDRKFKTYLNREFVEELLDGQSRDGITAYAVLTTAPRQTKAKLAGVVIWSTLDINENPEYNYEQLNDHEYDEPPMGFKNQGLQALAANSRVAEIKLVLTADDNPIKGLGRYLTLKAVYDIAAKTRRQGGQPYAKYGAIVSDVSGGTEFKSDAERRKHLPMFRIFEELGFKYVKRVDGNDFEEEYKGDPNTYDMYLMFKGDKFDEKLLTQVEQMLVVPSMNGLCPDRPRTGMNRCKNWTNRPGSPKKRSPKKGSPKKGSPKKGSSKKGSPKKGSPKKGSSKKGSPKKGSSKKGSPKKGSSKKGSPKRSGRKRK